MVQLIGEQVKRWAVVGKDTKCGREAKAGYDGQIVQGYSRNVGDTAACSDASGRKHRIQETHEIVEKLDGANEV